MHPGPFVAHLVDVLLLLLLQLLLLLLASAPSSYIFLSLLLVHHHRLLKCLLHPVFIPTVAAALPRATMLHCLLSNISVSLAAVALIPPLPYARARARERRPVLSRSKFSTSVAPPTTAVNTFTW